MSYVDKSYNSGPVASPSYNESNESAFTSDYANIAIMDSAKSTHDESISNSHDYNSSVRKPHNETVCSHVNALNYLGCINVKHLSSNTQKPPILNAQPTSVSRLSINHPPATIEYFTEFMLDVSNNNSNLDLAEKWLPVNGNAMKEQSETDQRQLLQGHKAFKHMEEKESRSQGDSQAFLHNNGILYKHHVFQARSQQDDLAKSNRSSQSRKIDPGMEQDSEGNESISQTNQSYNGTQWKDSIFKLNSSDNENDIVNHDLSVWNFSKKESFSCSDASICTVLQVCFSLWTGFYQ